MKTIPYKAALLDVDGTLLDSNDAHAHAYVEAMIEHNHPAEYATVRRLIGMGSDKLLPAAIGIQAESAVGERISKRKSEIFSRLLPGLHATEGARQLVEKLRESGLKRVVASSADKDAIKRLLKQASVEDLIEDEATADDAENSKPDPDILLAALRKAKVHASAAIMIGDTPYDIEAAKRAGLKIIALRCGGWGDRELAGAVEIYDHPAGLVQAWESSILAGRIE